MIKINRVIGSITPISAGFTPFFSRFWAPAYNFFLGPTFIYIYIYVLFFTTPIYNWQGDHLCIWVRSQIHQPVVMTIVWSHIPEKNMSNLQSMQPFQLLYSLHICISIIIYYIRLYLYVILLLSVWSVCIQMMCVYKYSWWFQPFEKYWSKWEHSPNRGEDEKNETTTHIYIYTLLFPFVQFWSNYICNRSTEHHRQPTTAKCNSYIYQHLQRGAKWFLNGVKSPSLRVSMAPLWRSRYTLKFREKKCHWIRYCWWKKSQTTTWDT